MGCSESGGFRERKAGDSSDGVREPRGFKEGRGFWGKRRDFREGEMDVWEKGDFFKGRVGCLGDWRFSGGEALFGSHERF